MVSPHYEFRIGWDCGIKKGGDILIGGTKKRMTSRMRKTTGVDCCGGPNARPTPRAYVTVNTRSIVCSFVSGVLVGTFQ